jgi:beta-N-acetylglucosaminidase
VKINKIIVFILVVSFIVMTLLSTFSTISLSDQQTKIDKLLQDNITIREKNDELARQLLEAKKPIPVITKTITPAPTLTNRSEVNDYNVARPSGRTAEQFEFILQGTKLAGLGQAIVDSEKEFSINGLFIVSVAQLESGYGTSYLARTKNNLFGLNAWGSTSSEITRRAYSYSSKALCVRAFSEIIRTKYLNKGRDTVKSISVIYCENATSWHNKICILLGKNIKKINEFKEVKDD